MNKYNNNQKKEKKDISNVSSHVIEVNAAYLKFSVPLGFGLLADLHVGCAGVIFERCLNHEQNLTCARSEIARELSLERMPNAACRHLLTRVDGGADKSHDREFDVFFGHRRDSGHEAGMRAHVRDEAIASREAESALFTGERALNRMQSLVSSEDTAGRASILAVAACEFTRARSLRL